MTIGAGITIEGQAGFGFVGNPTLPLVNEGTIEASGGGYLFLAGMGASSTGTLEALSGATLSVDRTWSITGSVNASGGTVVLLNTWSDTGSIAASSGGEVELQGTGSLSASTTFAGSGGSVYFQATLENTGTTVTLGDGNLSYLLSGGSIEGGTVAMTGGATLIGTTGQGTLDGVTLDGELDLATNNNASVTILGGLTLNGTILVGNSAGTTAGGLEFTGAQTLSGSGTIVIGDIVLDNVESTSANGDTGTLTIGPGITIEGELGQVGGAAPLINEGTIEATAGGTLLVGGPGSTSTGTLEASAGGVLQLLSSWAITGSVIASGGTVVLEGTSWSDTGSIAASSGGEVELQGTGSLSATTTFAGSEGSVLFQGTLDNTGTTLTLDDGNLSFLMAGGTIEGGTVAMTGGATLAGTTGSGTLDGVTLDGTLDLMSIDFARVSVLGGLTLFGTIEIGNAAGTTAGSLNFVGAQTLSGTGTVVLGGVAIYPYDTITDASNNGDSGTLTIGAGITIEGQSAVIGNASVPLVNEGTIEVSAGGLISVYGSGWTNDGTVEAAAGGTLDLLDQPSNLDAGTLTGGTWIVGSGGTLELAGGNVTTDAATIELTGAAQLLGRQSACRDRGGGQPRACRRRVADHERGLRERGYAQSGRRHARHHRYVHRAADGQLPGRRRRHHGGQPVRAAERHGPYSVEWGTRRQLDRRLHAGRFRQLSGHDRQRFHRPFHHRDRPDDRRRPHFCPDLRRPELEPAG